MAALVLVLCATPQLTLGDDKDRQEQPHMRAALDALQNAERELQAATHDKGGHREKALQLTRDAIAQVRQGMHYDNTHESKQEEHREHH
jgi:hypothetical protein